MFIRKILSELASLLAIVLMVIIAYLPRSFRILFAKVVAQFLFSVRFSRLNVIRTNLSTCFPKLSDKELSSLARSNLFNIVYGFTETAVTFHRSDKFIENMMSYSGLDIVKKYNRAGYPVILIVPHFVNLYLPIRFVHKFMPPASGIRKKQKSRFFELYYSLFFTRFGIHSIYQHETREAISLLRNKKNFVVLPDISLRMRNSIFVDFFGIKTATTTSVSRLARLGKAKVVAINCYRMPNYKYHIECEDLSEYMTCNDLEMDTTLISKTIENYVRSHPEQYLWSHKRFDIRPEGEPKFYQKKQAV